jgi:hypothetical protein
VKPYRHCNHDPAEGFCGEDVHDWFELTYASYLIVNRALLQEMPAEWQHRFVRCLEEMQATFEYPPQGQVHHAHLRDERGRFIYDPLRDYRYPPQHILEATRRKDVA